MSEDVAMTMAPTMTTVIADVSISDMKKIVEALCEAKEFFLHRDMMNGHLHLAATRTSPLTNKVAEAYHAAYAIAFCQPRRDVIVENNR